MLPAHASEGMRIPRALGVDFLQMKNGGPGGRPGESRAAQLTVQAHSVEISPHSQR